ncbi:MAG: hypothetical protein KAS07_02630 [Candidatus Pacebacteria bacterium]|nr:hypothetical protein [Candidatus Paceibacterota bacterium]
MIETQYFFEPNYVTSLLFFVAFLEGSLAIVLFHGSKEISTRAFSSAVFFTMLWTIFLGFHIAFPQQDTAITGTQWYLEFVADILHLWGVGVVFSIFYFCLTFLNEEKRYPTVFGALIAVAVVTAPLHFLGVFINESTIWWGTTQLGIGNVWEWNFGSFNLFYDIFFLGLPMVGNGFLLYRIWNIKELVKRKSLFAMFLVFTIGFIPSALGSVVLPNYFGIHQFHWMGGLTHVVWVSIAAYSIVKYNQMNVRYVITELLILAAMGLLFLSIFI